MVFDKKDLSPLFLLLLLLAFQACIDDEDGIARDTNAPHIQLIQPKDSSAFYAGQPVPFEAIFEDDMALSEFEIGIHDNFTNHDHGKTQILGWAYKQSFQIEGKKAHERMEIDIPKDAYPGEYHFIVFCLDKAGNQADFVEHTFYINAEASFPEFSLSNLKNTYDYSKPIDFEVKASDEQGIAALKIELLHADDGRYVYSNLIEDEFSAEGYPKSLKRDYRIAASLQGDNIEVGNYQLRIQVNNKAGLQQSKQHTLSISN